MRVEPRALVTLQLRVEVPGHWGGDCSGEQIHDQAVRSAVSSVNAALKDKPGIQILGTPKVEMVTTELKP